VSSDTELLVLRLAFSAVIFLALFAVAQSLRSGLRPRATAPARRTRLVVVGPAMGQLRPGAGFPLVGTMLIGRDPAAAIYIPDASVSGQHAEISPDGGGGWRVRDLGSLNGTYLNNVAVTAVWAPIRESDVLTVGTVDLRLREA
jgi:hypothetical protein